MRIVFQTCIPLVHYTHLCFIASNFVTPPLRAPNDFPASLHGKILGWQFGCPRTKGKMGWSPEKKLLGSVRNDFLMGGMWAENYD